MPPDSKVYETLIRHLQAIQDNDIDAYHATTSEELTLYEWWVTPHRIDGLPFHDFMLAENNRRGSVFGSEIEENTGITNKTRFDLSNLKIQQYGDAAVASYTLLTSTSNSAGIKVIAHHESRVMVRVNGTWKIVHVHKSPAWPAPHVGPG
jgi:hypothetical protein